MDVVKFLRDEANRYQREDGTPGDLACVWGWRSVAVELRYVARRIEAEQKREAEHAAKH